MGTRRNSCDVAFDGRDTSQLSEPASGYCCRARWSSAIAVRWKARSGGRHQGLANARRLGCSRTNPPCRRQKHFADTHQ